MRDIDKAIHLYELMAQRCESSGANHQAQIYREMVDFMGGCETAQQATEKIKKSKYYLGPSVALMQDRMEAFERAALENGMPEVARVYREKLEEIEADTGAIYTTGYEQRAMNVKVRYLNTYENFGKAYIAYVALCCAAANDKTAIDAAVSDLNRALAGLDLPSSDFSVLSQDPKFRAMIPAGDEAYARFVYAVGVISRAGADYSAELQQLNAAAETEWQAVKANKAQIVANGKKQLSLARKARAVAVAPADENGVYSYIDEEVR